MQQAGTPGPLSQGPVTTRAPVACLSGFASLRLCGAVLGKQPDFASLIPELGVGGVTLPWNSTTKPDAQKESERSRGSPAHRQPGEVSVTLCAYTKARDNMSAHLTHIFKDEVEPLFFWLLVS